jgi:hypothetical protein
VASREELLAALVAVWGQDEATKFEWPVDENGPEFFRDNEFPYRRLIPDGMRVAPPPGAVGIFRNSAG